MGSTGLGLNEFGVYFFEPPRTHAPRELRPRAWLFFSMTKFPSCVSMYRYLSIIHFSPIDSHPFPSLSMESTDFLTRDSLE